MTYRRIVVAAAAAVAINGLALAEVGSSDQPAQPQQQPGQVAPGGMQGSMQQMTPQQFVQKASQGSEFEIQSARLAEKQSEDPQVRKTAKELQKDHQKAQKELTKVADKNNWTVSHQLDPQQQQMLEELKGQTGQQFTQTFEQQQIQSHQQAIALYQDALTHVQNEDLKNYITRTLPKLQGHLTMLQTEQKKTAAQGAMHGGAQPAGSALPGSQQPQQGGMQQDQNR